MHYGSSSIVIQKDLYISKRATNDAKQKRNVRVRNCRTKTVPRYVMKSLSGTLNCVSWKSEYKNVLAPVNFGSRDFYHRLILVQAVPSTGVQFTRVLNLHKSGLVFLLRRPRHTQWYSTVPSHLVPFRPTPEGSPYWTPRKSTMAAGEVPTHAVPKFADIGICTRMVATGRWAE
eukprot:468946-Rhodomonas_salina.1